MKSQTVDGAIPADLAILACSPRGNFRTRMADLYAIDVRNQRGKFVTEEYIYVKESGMVDHNEEITMIDMFRKNVKALIERGGSRSAIKGCKACGDNPSIP